MKFRPLTGPELAKVAISDQQARAADLATSPEKWGDDGGEVTWTTVGCVFLGWYEEPPIRSHGEAVSPDAFPAYIVQVMGDPVPGWPGINVTGCDRKCNYGRGSEHLQH